MNQQSKTELSQSCINEINNECPSDQGIFLQPYGIPTDIKERVVYMRWETGGVSGGSYGESSNPTPYANDDPKPKFKVLDLILKRIKPDISYLQFREIEELIHTNEETNRDYYGNSTDYKIEYIILSELLNLLETF